MRQRPEDASLSELVSAARVGDRAAFRVLAARARDRIRRWALVRTGDPDEAEDVTQEVLLRLNRHLEKFDGRARFTTWLYRITANVASSRARRERRRADRLREGRWGAEAVGGLRSIGAEGGAGGGPPDPAGELLDRIESERLVALVRTFLEELPERQRQVFDLVDLRGHAPAEVAAMLELEGGTVRAHLFRARRTMRRRMLDLRPDLEETWG